MPKIIALVAVGYALSPIDLIPDFIPVFGYLDDLMIVPVLISLSIKLIPEQILSETRERAKRGPFKLKDNHFFAVLFIAIWITFFTRITIALVRFIKWDQH
ncbi:MAG TPA: DUF1232 domain-containing protein [Spirochaetota bacterium]